MKIKITNIRNNLYKIIDILKYNDSELEKIEMFYKKHKFFTYEIIKE